MSQAHERFYVVVAAGRVGPLHNVQRIRVGVRRRPDEHLHRQYESTWQESEYVDDYVVFEAPGRVDLRQQCTIESSTGRRFKVFVVEQRDRRFFEVSVPGGPEGDKENFRFGDRTTL